MLRVSIVLLPGGDASRARELGQAVIINTGEGTATSGDYAVFLSERDRQVGTCRITGWPRTERGPWELLLRALEEIFGRPLAPENGNGLRQERLLRVQAAARRLGRSPKTVWRLIRQGRLNGVRLGDRGLRVTESSLITYLLENKPDEGL